MPRGFESHRLRQNGAVAHVTVPLLFVNAVHRVAGGKHGLAAGFHVGRGVRVKAVIAVAVIRTERQVAPLCNLLRCGKACAQQVAAAGKAARVVIDTVIGGRNWEIHAALLDVNQHRGIVSSSCTTQ